MIQRPFHFTHNQGIEWHWKISIYKNRTVFPFDRLRVGMSNGRNAERLYWRSCHTAKWWLAVCWPCSIAATCCRFWSSAFRLVDVKAMPDRMRECLHRCVRWYLIKAELVVLRAINSSLFTDELCFCC